MTCRVMLNHGSGATKEDDSQGLLGKGEIKREKIFCSFHPCFPTYLKVFYKKLGANENKC